MNILDIFYPKFCVGCNSFGHYLCLNCQSDIQTPEYFSEEEIVPLDGLWSLGHYSGVLEKLIHSIKYRFVTDIFTELRPILARELQVHLLPEDLQIITFVPIHPKRQSQRGFNQSQLLATQISQITGIPLQTLLQKTKITRPQVGLEALEREENLKGAFSLISGSNCQGQNILLIDDVWTTGSTMKECCKVLKEGGANKVYALTLAR